MDGLAELTEDARAAAGVFMRDIHEVCPARKPASPPVRLHVSWSAHGAPQLFEHLVALESLDRNPRNEDERVQSCLQLIRYLKDSGKTAVFEKYLQFLCELHESLGNWVREPLRRPRTRSSLTAARRSSAGWLCCSTQSFWAQATRSWTGCWVRQSPARVCVRVRMLTSARAVLDFKGTHTGEGQKEQVYLPADTEARAARACTREPARLRSPPRADQPQDHAHEDGRLVLYALPGAPRGVLLPCWCTPHVCCARRRGSGALRCRRSSWGSTSSPSICPRSPSPTATAPSSRSRCAPASPAPNRRADGQRWHPRRSRRTIASSAPITALRSSAAASATTSAIRRGCRCAARRGRSGSSRSSPARAVGVRLPLVRERARLQHAHGREVPAGQGTPRPSARAALTPAPCADLERLRPAQGDDGASGGCCRRRASSDCAPSPQLAEHGFLVQITTLTPSSPDEMEGKFVTCVSLKAPGPRSATLSTSRAR